MAKNILITGSNGQLGNEMRKILNDNSLFNTFYTDVKELDITDANAVNDFVAKNGIDIIINCAAYTAVDAAEDNEELCSRINTLAIGNLANAALHAGIKVIHISTDYVFDGMKNTPYKETDNINPQSIYGRTKAEGEQKLMETLPDDSIIIRTAWLYSTYGNNFVKTMIELGHSRTTLNVVSDQIGTPTYAGDLANAIYSIITAPQWIPGIYHFTDEGVCSWYDFTKAIHRLAGINTCIVAPILTNEYPTKAHRPTYSVLDKNKIKKTFNLLIPHWEESLEKCIKELENNI